MSTSYETDRSTLGTQFVASWTATRIHVPNQQFEPPDPTGSTTMPATYVGFDIAYDAADQITFGGTEQRIGRIRHGIWQEIDTGDAAALQLVDDLRDLWAAVSVAGYQIFPKQALLGDALTDGTWVGRLLDIPFWRIEG